MTRHLDPDRRRPAPPHPGFAQLPLDVDSDVCRLCRALVPATELARARHVEWDAKVVMVATVALTSQLSGSVAPPKAPADPDPPSSPPTPPQEASTAAGRGGVEGANHHTQAGAGLPSSASESPGGVAPPPLGDTQPPRPADSEGKAAAGRDSNDDDEDEQLALDTARYEAGPEPAGWAS
jgi:hypothetical protein